MLLVCLNPSWSRINLCGSELLIYLLVGHLHDIEGVSSNGSRNADFFPLWTEISTVLPTIFGGENNKTAGVETSLKMQLRTLRDPPSSLRDFVSVEDIFVSSNELFLKTFALAAILWTTDCVFNTRSKEFKVISYLWSGMIFEWPTFPKIVWK